MSSLGKFHRAQSTVLVTHIQYRFLPQFIASCTITGVLEKNILEQGVKSSNSVKVRKILAELQQENKF